MPNKITCNDRPQNFFKWIDSPVPQNLEEIDEVVKFVPDKHVQLQTHELFVDIPISQVLVEIAGMVRLVSQERRQRVVAGRETVFEGCVSAWRGQEIESEGYESALGRWQWTESYGRVWARERWQETDSERCASVEYKVLHGRRASTRHGRHVIVGRLDLRYGCSMCQRVSFRRRSLKL